jgi:hypothetical protein
MAKTTPTRRQPARAATPEELAAKNKRAEERLDEADAELDQIEATLSRLHSGVDGLADRIPPKPEPEFEARLALIEARLDPDAAGDPPPADWKQRIDAPEEDTALWGL